MPLTRHLYEMDEVVAALQLCLRGYHGYTSRALFWTWELVASCEPTTALTTIRNTWLAYGGGFDPTVIALLPQNQNEWVDLVLRANEAIHLAKASEHTVAKFMLATATMPTKPAAKGTPLNITPPIAFTAALADEAIDPVDGVAWWRTLYNAVRTNSRTEAFWLLQAAQPTLSTDTIWTALQSMTPPELQFTIPPLKANIEQFDPVQQAAAQGTLLLLLCATPAERANMLGPQPPPAIHAYRKDWADWSAIVGRRAARRYPIPPDALHAGTTRGSLEYKYTNIGDVRDPVPSLGEACLFWRKALLLHGIEVNEDDNTVAFPDDDVIEAFYEAYFPDDIPDEWSAVDQQKSHGRGMSQPARHPAPPPPIREEPHDYEVWAAGIGLA